jgi:alpha-amylase
MLTFVFQQLFKINRIYADIVINHMAADQVNFTAVGTGGSIATPTTRDYPAIPFSKYNFHPTCALVNYQDAYQVRNCELVGLHDLNQTEEETRDRIVNYMNHLIDLGVAGFRVDASKHMWPSDLEIIYNRVKYLNTTFGFDAKLDPFIYQEVIDTGYEAVSKYEYTFASVTEFRYSSEIGRSFTGQDELHWLSGFGEKWNLLPSHLAMIFVDNHDSQRSGDGAILTYKLRKNYIMAQAFSLAHPYGVKRIMSSFAYEDRNQGPPADKDENIISPEFDEDGNCTNGWVCEHRWHAIASMVEFMDVVGDENITSWWDNGKNQIAFSRGSKGFVVFNLDNYDMVGTIIETSMKPGLYCDIISGEKISDKNCSGEILEVKFDGTVAIYLGKDDPNGVFAIHVGQEVFIV